MKTQIFFTMPKYNLQKNPQKETKIFQNIIYYYKEMSVGVLMR